MADRQLRVGIGQIDCALGDLEANLATVEQVSHDAAARGCDLVVFPELALSGYAVGPGFSETSLHPTSPAVDRLRRLSRRIAIVLGLVEETEDAEFYNSALFVQGGHIRHVHRKIYLPNYRVFDERRYFGAGQGIWAFDTPWCRMAILICGDMWHLAMPYLATHDGADLLLVLAASSTEGLTPSISVRDAWERMNRSYALALSNFVVFANRVGRERPAGNNGVLEFWGGSHICGPDGQMLCQAAIGTQDLLVADLDLSHLRRQRLILPFRRDDNLGFALEVGRKIVRAKSRRRDGFHSLTTSSSTMDFDVPDTGNAGDPPPTPSNL